MVQQLFHLSKNDFRFPPNHYALLEPDGLLAVGGCLRVERLKQAYANGVFPWFNEGEPIMWWTPSERGILELDEFHCGKTLKKAQRKLKPTVTVNTAFNQVIEACRDQRMAAEGTWITNAMLSAYQQAHIQGIAHSVEIWHEEKLVGGLYGIMQSGVFCGESMFHTVPNTSKMAMWALVNWLKAHKASFIDCQLENPYLTSLGLKVIPRPEFLTRLKLAGQFQVPSSMWQPQELKAIYE
ncbi:leucyl/phenylalanyl-tRNA--protein transferase [Pseudoalteromonas peptidolytica]|nr:leucyl/phenylalanyl-tRNA--protein transferase [Pseudoalteromonas peptidolytica]NLR14558.1 leucyl/phenylalanyl-tRNA--protein transferase [Pseudoalteromonas peptidolytica]GEK09288.1 leucyl/phenylalanyl-tRNA--protein transferase [Pseudoalteromonas peptidolytica]